MVWPNSGTSPPPALTGDEIILLDAFRALHPLSQFRLLMAMVCAYAETIELSPKPTPERQLRP